MIRKDPRTADRGPSTEGAGAGAAEVDRQAASMFSVGSAGGCP